MARFPKLGIIAGSGDLPYEVIRACQKQRRSFFIVALDGHTNEKLIQNLPHQWIHIGKIGHVIKTLRLEEVKEVVLAGSVGRPPLSELRMDFSAVKLLSKLAKLPEQGDNAVFSTIVEFLESKKFTVIGADQILTDLIMPPGVVGKKKPDKSAEHDIALGLRIAQSIGNLDIGQAVVVQRGQVLGVEGAEGTDGLISRCKNLHQEGPGGVLVKIKKPGQDPRVDLPCLGVSTITNAAKSGLRGIAAEAGSTLLIKRDKLIAKADALDVFLTGISAHDSKQIH